MRDARAASYRRGEGFVAVPPRRSPQTTPAVSWRRWKPGPEEDRHARRRARSWCRSPAGRCRSQYDGIRAGAPAQCAAPAASSTSPTWARSRPRARRRPSSCSGCSPTTSRRSRSAAPSTRASAARTAGCSTTSSPTGSADDRYLTVINAANHERDLEWFAGARGRVRRRGPRPDRRLRDARGAGPQARGDRRAARRRRAAARASRTAELAVAGAPALVCGTGYTGEDGVELLMPPEDAPDGLGRADRRGRRPAGLGARDTLRLEVNYSPLRQRPDRGARRRSRPASAGASRRTPASSARRHAGAVRERGPSEILEPFVITGAGHPAPGQPDRRRRCRTWAR